MNQKVMNFFLATIFFITNAIIGQTAEVSSQLTSLQTENLVVLCKTWGIVKFYCTNEHGDIIQLDQELMSLIPTIEMAKSREACDDILLKWVTDWSNKVGDISSESDVTYSKVYDGERWISALSNDLSQKLTQIIENGRSHENESLYVDENGFHNFDKEMQYLFLKDIDKEHRLLSLFRYWNIFELFSPNKDVLDKDWDQVLLEMLPIFYNAKEAEDYQAALMKLAYATNDSHTSVFGTESYFNSLYGAYIFPSALKRIEDKVVVDESEKNDKALKRGDIITHINGVPINVILNYSEFNAYSNETGKQLEAFRILRHSKFQSNRVTFQRGNQTQTVFLEYVLTDHFPLEHKVSDNPLKVIEKDVLYVNYGFLTPQLEAELVEQLKTAKIVIMDLRNYPMKHQAIYTLIDAFLPYSKPMMEVEIADVYKPGNLTKEMIQLENAENPDFYKGELICLVNEDTVSHNEFSAIWLKKAPKTIIMGSKTCGADGDVRRVPMMGLCEMYYGSVGIHEVDGSETQRTGVKVDVFSKQSYEGFLMGEDDLLNTALKHAKKLQAHKVKTASINGVEMVALKEALVDRPFEISFDDPTQTFTIKNGAEKTTLTLGKNLYTRYDGKDIMLKSGPVIHEGDLYVPKSYLMEVLSLDLVFE